MREDEGGCKGVKAGNRKRNMTGVHLFETSGLLRAVAEHILF